MSRSNNRVNAVETTFPPYCKVCRHWYRAKPKLFTQDPAAHQRGSEQYGMGEEIWERWDGPSPCRDGSLPPDQTEPKSVPRQGSKRVCSVYGVSHHGLCASGDFLK